MHKKKKSKQELFYMSLFSFFYLRLYWLFHLLILSDLFVYFLVYLIVYIFQFWQLWYCIRKYKTHLIKQHKHALSDFLWFAGKIIFTLFMLEGMQTLTQILVWSRSGICNRTDTWLVYTNDLTLCCL